MGGESTSLFAQRVVNQHHYLHSGYWILNTTAFDAQWAMQCTLQYTAGASLATQLRNVHLWLSYYMNFIFAVFKRA